MSEEVRYDTAANPDAPETAEATETAAEPEAPESPLELADKIASGTLKLAMPIQDGDRTYTELKFDFKRLTGWELAKALSAVRDTQRSRSDISEPQALALFAAAAAKCTNGLDARDIRERMGAMDAVAAISMGQIFFRATLLAGSARITNA